MLQPDGPFDLYADFTQPNFINKAIFWSIQLQFYKGWHHCVYRISDLAHYAVSRCHHDTLLTLSVPAVYQILPEIKDMENTYIMENAYISECCVLQSEGILYRRSQKTFW